MSQPTDGNPFGAPLGDIWNDVPLFREIQRVLLSSSGPVNWELARQVGIASASWGKDDPAPTDDDRTGFDEAVRVAELQVSSFTGLEPPIDLPNVEPASGSRRASRACARCSSRPRPRSARP